jgi:hypothetical protein
MTDRSRAGQLVQECSECAHVFSAQELAKEDPTAWGHPCWGMKRKGTCESYRTPKVLTDVAGRRRATEPPDDSLGRCAEDVVRLSRATIPETLSEDSWWLIRNLVFMALESVDFAQNIPVPPAPQEET